MSQIYLPYSNLPLFLCQPQNLHFSDSDLYPHSCLGLKLGSHSRLFVQLVVKTCQVCLLSIYLIYFFLYVTIAYQPRLCIISFLKKYLNSFSTGLFCLLAYSSLICSSHWWQNEFSVMQTRSHHSQVSSLIMASHSLQVESKHLHMPYKGLSQPGPAYPSTLISYYFFLINLAQITSN